MLCGAGTALAGPGELRMQYASIPVLATHWPVRPAAASDAASGAALMTPALGHQSLHHASVQRAPCCRALCWGDVLCHQGSSLQQDSFLADGCRSCKSEQAGCMQLSRILCAAGRLPHSMRLCAAPMRQPRQACQSACTLLSAPCCGNSSCMPGACGHRRCVASEAPDSPPEEPARPHRLDPESGLCCRC